MENIVLENKTEEVLGELDSIYGIDKSKELIRNYAAYVKMKKEGKINLGTYNIVIENMSESEIPEQIIKVICKILKVNDIINTSYKYLEMDELRENRGNNKDKKKKNKKINEDLLIIHANKLDSSIRYIKSDIRELIKKYPKKVVIIVYKKAKEDFFFSYDEYDDSYFRDIITWKIKIEELTKENKINYIEKYMKQNSIKIDSKSGFKEKLATKSFSEIKEELFNIVIECKIRKIDKITDKVVKDDLKRKYFKNNSDNKSGLEELNSLIGIDSVKSQVEKIINFVKINKQRRKLPMLHMCFMGNPGTGKTTVARIIGKLFSEMEVLSKDNIFVEAQRQDLIGEYIGHTAPKTKRVVDSANGGVLFIDEAYSLSPKESGKDYGHECIATLLKEMEDKRDSLCVILAGYTKEMNELLKVNPGFDSRIQFKLEFPDYTEEELYKIFKQMAKNENYKIANNVKEIVIKYFSEQKKKENFANARCARNLFEKIKFEQANRIAKEEIELQNESNDGAEDKNKMEKEVKLNLIKKIDVENVLATLEVKEEEKIRIGFAS